MGKSNNQSLTIHFGNPRRVYQAGDRVTGSVMCNVEEPKDSASVELKMCGKASVAFARDTGSKRRERFFAFETFLIKQLSLWPQGPSYGGPSHTLGVGHHEFPFSFRLPADVPSSFHCSSGNIRYCLKASLRLDGKSTKAKEFFVFYQPLPLNLIPSAMYPIEEEEEMSLWCACCASGKVYAHVTLPKRAFVPGETITVHADIVNNSSARITKTYFVIEQIAHCHAMGKTDTLRKELKNCKPLLEHPRISPGGSDKWTGEAVVRVPVTMPTGLQGTGIIDLEHQLALYVIPAGMACTMRMGVNIVIGSAPFGHGEDTAEVGLEGVHPAFASGGSHGGGSKGGEREPLQERPDLDRDLTWESRYGTTQV